MAGHMLLRGVMIVRETHNRTVLSRLHNSITNTSLFDLHFRAGLVTASTQEFVRYTAVSTDQSGQAAGWLDWITVLGYPGRQPS